MLLKSCAAMIVKDGSAVHYQGSNKSVPGAVLGQYQGRARAVPERCRGNAKAVPAPMQLLKPCMFCNETRFTKFVMSLRA